MAACNIDGKPAEIVCSRIAKIDTELHIRHGTVLVLCLLSWLVTDQTLGEPLLGRPIPEALDLNRRKILAAAAEKHAGIVDVSELVTGN